jgi:hypothetical protein
LNQGSLLLDLGKSVIHRAPLFTGVVGINDGGDCDYNSGSGCPKIRANEHSTQLRKRSSKYPGYSYMSLGVACMFFGIVCIGMTGSAPKWYLGVITLFFAIALILSSVRLINHALDLIDDTKNVSQKHLTHTVLL